MKQIQIPVGTLTGTPTQSLQICHKQQYKEYQERLKHEWKQRQEKKHTAREG